MRQMLLSFFALACWPLYAEVEVTFPVEAKPAAKLTTGAKLNLIIPGLAQDDAPKAVRIDGVVIFYTVGHCHLGETQKPESFDKLKEGMTLKEIVSLLGPGSQNKFAGIGFICWRCEDGRILQVWPTQQLNEKAKYHVILTGTDQRHEDVARLTKALISSLNTNNLKVEVVLTQDTHQAKAGQVRTYGVGQGFQKVDPLPGLSFTIRKIEGDSVHCHYAYRAPTEGLLHYMETGSLILRNREQGGEGQPSTGPESKPEAGQNPKPESEGRAQSEVQSLLGT